MTPCITKLLKFLIKIRFATLQILHTNKYFPYSWNAYISQFSNNSWVLVSAWLLTSAVVYWLIKRYQQSSDEKKRMKETNSIFETVFTFYSVVVQQGEFQNILSPSVYLILFITSKCKHYLSWARIFFYKKNIITLIMLARSPERIFRIGIIRLLEEANAYILPQTAGR